MKKLLILCLAFALFFASCGTGGQNKDNNPSSQISNSSTQSDTQSGTQSEGLPSEDLSTEFDDGLQDSSGQLMVNTTITKPNTNENEILPGEDTADLMNPEVLKEAGANKQALAMRKKVLNAKDSISVSGTTYYVSSKGSDSNDGKSKNTPFQTLNYAITVATKEGDALLLERGSVFRLENTITLANGVTYGAYGTGAKPEVWGSLENYAQPQRWTPYTIRNVWAIDYMRGDVGIIVFNHGELAGDMQYYVRNLKKNGDFFYDNVQNVLYVYSDKGNPGNVYKDIEIGSKMILFRLRNGAQDVTIDNISFKYTGTFGIRGSMGCRNINITNCVIGWVGGSLFNDASNRYGNGIEFTAGCENLTVENCWIYQAYDAGFTFQITTPDSTVEERTYRNIDVKNNLIEYCSWAYEWWPSDDICEIEDISVTGNIMRFSGYGWAGDARTPSHIRGPWSAKNFEAKNFVISNNIFDCSNGPIYAWIVYGTEQLKDLMSGNSYYQKKPTSKRIRYEKTPDYVFEFDYNGQSVYKVGDQKALDIAISKIDPDAKVVKWLK